ncbi:MAG: hypothetical protein ACLQG3_14100 [Terracidiphilus sp.]
MTLITRSHLNDGSYAPCALNFLEQVPDAALFNKPHKLRHPSSIYRLSLDKIADAFCRVTDEYLAKTEENQLHSSALLQMNQLLTDQAAFLHCIQEHLDELWMILKTLVDPASVKKSTEFNDRYVIESKLPGAKSFQRAIAECKNNLRIANKLKHQQCYLRGVAIWSQTGVHLGYCLEEPDDHGQLGPSPDIHPDQGAFSFARDLTWRLAQVYLCSEDLVKTIAGVLMSRGFALKGLVNHGNDKWDKMIPLACRIPPAIFPKEQNRPFAGFNLDLNSQLLSIRIPQRLTVKFPQPMKARYATVTDRHNTAHRVPLP